MANSAKRMVVFSGERPVLVGTVGEDFSEYRDWLAAKGVETSKIKVIAGEHTASCFINTDLQDNQITAFYPAPWLKHPQSRCTIWTSGPAT